MLSDMSVATMPMESLALEGLQIGSYGNCVVTIWSGEATRATLDAIDRFSAKVYERWPAGTTLLVVLEPGCPMPNSEQRRDLDQYYLSVGNQVRGVAQVVEGGNLWAVMARSVMTALRLVQKSPYPMKVFASAQEGADWISEYVTTEASDDRAKIGTELLNYVGALRAGKA